MNFPSSFLLLYIRSKIYFFELDDPNTFQFHPKSFPIVYSCVLDLTLGKEKKSNLASKNPFFFFPERASISTSQASSSTSIPHSYGYDVFLSFRGDHLYNTLVAYGIRDEELQKGEEMTSNRVSQQLSKTLKIFIIILSENFDTSNWCLNELVKIVECTTTTDDDDKRSVIPVFYHVQPRDVGHLSGSFQDAFLNHEKYANQEKKEMIKKWRIALEKVAKLSGYHVDNQ